tara:strand:+ start:560 stop:799 length:240 start_codon:yes stop_codon:yes gene_type:complete
MRILNDHLGEMNGEVRIEGYEEVDVLYEALLLLSTSPRLSMFTDDYKEKLENMLPQLHALSTDMYNAYCAKTFTDRDKV